MTIICAFHKPGVGTWIGSDTQETENGISFFLLHSKWARSQRWAAGSCGWAICGNVLRSQADYLLDNDVTPETFRERLRNSLTAASVCPQEKAMMPDYEIGILLAGPDGVYDFDNHLQYTKRVGFVAKGSGELLAYGAAHVLQQRDIDPVELLFRSMSAAIRYDIQCGGKPVIGFIPARGA